jgi:4-hydroxybenzoate polyprenyltransferase
MHSVLARVKSLLIASHFGPTVLVVTLSFCISISQFSPTGATLVAIAIFMGQLVVGWSNEVIDYPLDVLARRVQKPLVSQDLKVDSLKKLIPVALIGALVLSLASPLGLIGTSLHMLGILSATFYNIKLKSTILSPLPYAISFGALPWAIFLAAGRTPPLWLYLGIVLFALSFHFLNVLKDLEWDIQQGILGLPQRIGKRKSIIVSVVLALLGVVVLLIQSPFGI